LPDNLLSVLIHQGTLDNPIDIQSQKVTSQSTFGFKPTHTTPEANPVIMAPELFNTVARYLHHQRWIWYFPNCTVPEFTVKDASEILSIITKYQHKYSTNSTLSIIEFYKNLRFLFVE
jgi:hypothetical protein